MIKDLHGKHYYISMNTYQEVLLVEDFISNLEALKDELWTLTKVDHKWILFSDAHCGDFRGAKYSAWEKVKRFYYKIKA